MPKNDPLVSLRRLVLLGLAIVLCCLALVPSAMAACCTEGSTRTITSIQCCTDPPVNANRTLLHQTCHSCNWNTTSTSCTFATSCAF